MVASKFLHDHGEEDVYNDEWAASAGISVQEMNHYERDFLKAMVSDIYKTKFHIKNFFIYNAFLCVKGLGSIC